ncbi:hypothetical protein B0H21DRAFT_402463 [Amylocystis lapponica]|nr:hypothetical protein B0H21DRAFT_402463 [Amylocystis lapponica]
MSTSHVPSIMTTPVSNGVSSRDRKPSHRSEHTSSHSSPHRNPTTSSHANAQPITADALLSANSAAPNPPLAALDAAVSDRNSLATQNAQLWKLIEKQRAGYSQLVKEVERVRGERDTYRVKLQSLGENTDALIRTHRDRDKREGKEGTLRSAVSHSHLRGSEGSVSSMHNNLDPKGHIVRTASDDPASRVASQRLVSSRSQDPLSQSQHSFRDTEGSQLNNLSSNYSVHSSSTTSLSTPQRSSDDIVRRPPPLPLSPMREAFSESINSTSESQPPSASSGATHTSSTTSPPSSAKSIPNGDIGDPILGPWAPTLVSRDTLRIAPPKNPGPVLLTPATPSPTSSHYGAQAGAFPNNPFPLPNVTSPANTLSASVLKPGDVVLPSSRPSSPSRPHPPRSSSFPQPSPTTQPQPLPGTQPALPNTLSPHLNGGPIRSYALSRESRISLPEEAKRYYAAMGDSPVASPNPGGAFAFSPVNGSESSAKSQMAPISEASAPAQPRVSESSARERARAGSVAEEGAPFLDMGDEDSLYDSVSGSGADISGRPSTTDDGADDDAYGGMDENGETVGRWSKEKRKRAVVEDFPLPPSSTPAHPGSAASGLSPPDASRLHGDPTMPEPPPSPFSATSSTPQMKFRALPLLATDLPHTEIYVANSTIRPNDRGKEVLSFVIVVEPGKGKLGWKVEKLYSDVLGLDARVRATVGKTVGKKMVALPEGRLWRDHAPAKVDQRKTALESYLRSLIALPVKNKNEVVAFFTSDIVRDASKPVSQAGYKEGYLTKRGKNFGGWKSRYFVLQGPSLEYYESRGGAHLGSITITGAQIGRQQRAQDKRESDEDNEYRHAFLIIEARKAPGVSSTRHVLCAQSDYERDSWVEELVRYVSGTYSEDQIAVIHDGVIPIAIGSVSQSTAASQPRSSTSTSPSEAFTLTRRVTRDIAKGAAVPISKLVLDNNNAKLFQTSQPLSDDRSVGSPAKSSAAPSPIDQLGAEGPLSSSLPVSSPLLQDDTESLSGGLQRANSELGHYPDLVDQRAGHGRQGHMSPEHLRKKTRRMSVNLMKAPIPERDPSPEKEMSPHTPRVDAHGKVKISGPMNGTPIPMGYKFGGKDAPADAQSTVSTNDRREKAKSRMFWNFGRNGAHDKPNVPTMAPRAVFGVNLEESLDVAQIASLPAIVFRCIEYLETKKAEEEEGIYRLSGSSAVIKSIKDRFNAEGDIDLLGTDEDWDPHAIAGLLKTFLRELPASILTRDLHLRFLAVIDFVDPQERIQELTRLIAALPQANYCLLRALTAHLILIVQNAGVNKMTMRNVGIVFSPTLGIPAGVFSLMLGEFKRVFNVDGTLEQDGEPSGAEGVEQEPGLDRRNSQHYTEAAADQLLGLSGRTLGAEDDAPSDEEASIVEESATEGTTENDSDVVESSATSSSAHQPQGAGAMVDAPAATSGSRAAHLAATRGLNVVTDKAARRHSRMVGLPGSPRPSPRTPNAATSPAMANASLLHAQQ